MAIKAEELRIGNWIEIKGICPELRGDIFDAQQLNIYNLQDIYNGSFEDFIFRAIPLTEEWLLKLGFDWDSICWQKGLILLAEYRNNNYHVFYNTLTWGRINDLKIQYVHQLQNLYYALTGEELTIN